MCKHFQFFIKGDLVMNLIFDLKSGGYWEGRTGWRNGVSKRLFGLKSSTLNLNIESLAKDVSVECRHTLDPVWPLPPSHI